MMAKDSVKKRIEGDAGMSFTEFTYQLVQGYDFYWLYTNKNCKLQMGGSDQWGNIVTGTELIRRKANGLACAGRLHGRGQMRSLDHQAFDGGVGNDGITASVAATRARGEFKRILLFPARRDAEQGKQA